MYRIRIPAPLGKGRMTQQTWCVTSTETIRLIRDGDKMEGGGTEVGGGGGGGREIINLSLHCHHQNDFCIKMGSEESHLNVSLIVRDKVTRQRPQTTTFEEKGEPKRIRTEVPLLTSLTPYRRLFIAPCTRVCWMRVLIPSHVLADHKTQVAGHITCHLIHFPFVLPRPQRAALGAT